MTQTPSPQARSDRGPADAPRVAGSRRGRTGGRVAGQAYAPPAPRVAGGGTNKWPQLDYSEVQPRSLREAYEWWQQICRDIAPRRRARGWEQADLAREAGISVNTLQRVERGEWVSAANLFQVCSVLDLRVEQTVDLDDRADDYGRGSDPRRDRRLGRPAAEDHIATLAEVLASRVVIAALARHHHLLDPSVGPDGTVYVRSNSSDFAPLWRFASVVSQTLNAWVNVSSDQGAANRDEATPL